MTRHLVQALDLVSDAALIAEYERRHAPGAVWPRVVGALRRSGVREMEIWRTDDHLCLTAEVADDYPRPADAGLTADLARLEREMAPIQRRLCDGGSQWSDLRRVFSLAEQAGPVIDLERRTHGRTGLSLSILGFGAAPLGNLYRPVGDIDAAATLRTALDEGIGYVDTAPFYGFGLSERRVGDALRGRSGVVVSTKVGRLLAPSDAAAGAIRQGFRSPMPFTPTFDYSYDGVLRSWEASRHRMGIARIDLLFVHDIGAATHGASGSGYMRQLTDGGGFRALEQLRAAGEITGFGLGVNEWQVCLEAMDHTDLDIVLLAGRYTLLEQTALDSFFLACVQRGVGVVVGGPYNSGILATGTRGDGPKRYDYAAAPPDIVAKVQAIETVCASHGVPLAAAALRFPLAHPAVLSVIPGIDSPEQVLETLDLMASAIPEMLWQDLRDEKLIRGDAPLPGCR